MTWQEQLKELLDLEEGLSDWEVTFVEDLSHDLNANENFDPAPGRILKLNEIYEQRIVNGEKPYGREDD